MSGLNFVRYSTDYELVAEIVEADYSWHAIGVWRDTKTDQFFWATDSGRSCYGPWEELEDKDLTALTEGNFAEFVVEAESFVTHEIPATDVTKFLHYIQQQMNIFSGVHTVGRD